MSEQQTKFADWKLIDGGVLRAPLVLKCRFSKCCFCGLVSQASR